MITSAPEALALHEKMAKELWQRALKGRGRGGVPARADQQRPSCSALTSSFTYWKKY